MRYGNSAPAHLYSSTVMSVVPEAMLTARYVCVLVVRAIDDALILYVHAVCSIRYCVR